MLVEVIDTWQEGEKGLVVLKNKRGDKQPAFPTTALSDYWSSYLLLSTWKWVLFMFDLKILK